MISPKISWYDTSMDNRKNNRGRPTLYRWDEWLAQPRTVLVPGNHFVNDVDAFVQQLHDAASARQIRTRIVRDGDDIILWTRAPIRKAQASESFTTESTFEGDTEV